MSFATTRRDIEQRFVDNWATTIISFDNVPFNKPENDTEWVYFRIFENPSQRITLSRRSVHRATGLIAVQIYVAKNTGTQLARSYADTIAAIFRDQQFNGVTCQEASVTNVGDFENWYQVNVTIPYYVDAVYSV